MKKSNFLSGAGLAPVTSFLILAALAISEAPSKAQFPAIGADTGPGTIITITSTKASIFPTGQGPYDGNDDTYVAVINNSSRPISTMQIRSAANIFAFDGDGLSGTDPNTGMPFTPGGPYGPTGYEGPGTSFSNISADQTSGTVNFNPPIAPKGGTAYFSLENAIGSVCSAADVLNNSVTTVANQPHGGDIDATFTPKCGGTGGNPPTLQQAADLCGFNAFNWQQTITELPAPSPFYAAGNTTTPLVAPPAFNDPPPNGYAYQIPPNAVELPIYYNLFTAPPDRLSLLYNEHPTQDPTTSTTLTFHDYPGYKSLPPGKHMAFTVRLVGIVGYLPGAAVVDTGIGFNYISTCNKTSGGVSILNNAGELDEDSGTGSNTITSFQNTTTYEYNGIVVTTLNGLPVGQDTNTLLVTASASPSTLSPANGRMIKVTVSGQIMHNENSKPFGDRITATYSVTTQHGQVVYNGNVHLPPDGSYSFVVQLQALRETTGTSGLTYIVTVAAKDTVGNKASTNTDVIVSP